MEAGSTASVTRDSFFPDRFAIDSLPATFSAMLFHAIYCFNSTLIAYRYSFPCFRIIALPMLLRDALQINGDTREKAPMLTNRAIRGIGVTSRDSNG